MIYQEVIDYWRSKGFVVRARTYLGFEQDMLTRTGSLLYDTVKDGLIHQSVAIVFSDPNRKTIYYIDSQAFYGEEILKVLKLKAFL